MKIQGPQSAGRGKRPFVLNALWTARPLLLKQRAGHNGIVGVVESCIIQASSPRTTAILIIHLGIFYTDCHALL